MSCIRLALPCLIAFMLALLISLMFCRLVHADDLAPVYVVEWDCVSHGQRYGYMIEVRDGRTLERLARWRGRNALLLTASWLQDNYPGESVATAVVQTNRACEKVARP